MWKIFSKKDLDIEDTINSIEIWKKEIFSLVEVTVKEYFAKKVTVYFDNNMIFQQKRGLHFNLMEALSTAEKEMLNSGGVFGKIELYWLREEDNQILIIFGLDDDKEYTLTDMGFNLIKKDALPLSNNLEELEHNSWKTLIFDVELVNYVTSWINYTPNIEERSVLQAEYILFNMHFKNQDIGLLERIEFEENIKHHSSYKELCNKVLRIMPKIESSLEQEWNTGKISTKDIKTKQKKTGIKK
jgi:hypothetical protein